MKLFTVSTLAILICSFAGWSQTCYQATGQTAAVTLSPGSKKIPAAIHQTTPFHAGINRGAAVMSTRGEFLFSLPAIHGGVFDIFVYNVEGRLLFRQRAFNGAALQLDTRTFSAGIYTAYVQVGGQNFLRRFIVSR